MAICKQCGQVIRFELTKAGKWQPVNLDGSVHFPTCRANVAEGRDRIKGWYKQLPGGDELAGDTVQEGQADEPMEGQA